MTANRITEVSLKRHFGIFSTLLIFLFSLPLVGYTQVPLSSEEKARLQLEQENLKYKEMELKLLEESFEGAIDPESYITGPGDYFAIDIGGEIQKDFKVLVTAEGVLIIPTVGGLKIDGLTLQSAQLQVRDAISAKYKSTEISVNLLKVRRIRVHITGRISNPGTYVVTPIDRVSNLIYRAGGLGVHAKQQELQIKHRDNEETLIDFSAFQQFGDLSQNPYVRSGDIIIVPPVNFAEEVVRVEGFISRPGYYPIKPDETLFEFLNRYGILNLTQKISEISINRDGDVFTFDMTDEKAQQTILRAEDAITIPKMIREVYVMGAVLKPGSYRFVSNLRAKDYAGEAGPTEDAASLDKIRVHHTDTGISEKGENASVYPGDVIEVPTRPSRRLSEYLQIAGTIATLVIAYSAINRN